MKHLRNNRGSGKLTLLFVIYIVVIVAILLFSLVRGVWVDESIAVKAMKTQGYSNIEVVDYAWFAVCFRGCGKDAARFTVKATNPAGKDIKCYVCAGWPFKGATIRTK